MENHLFDPFFENCRTSSPRARSFPREVPVTPSPRRYTGNSPVNYDRENRTPSAAAAHKVVSIPVRSIGQEKKRSSASLKIQKVFRGFLIRKSVKKIVGIKRAVDEIERKLSEKDTMELIYSNTKERLKMNEMLMRLLLRLDLIRGVDSGVRDARKSVTRKTIMLQDRFDKIAAGDLMHEEENAGDQEGAECEDSNDASEDMEICESVVDQLVEQVRETPEKGNEGNSMTESPEKSNMDGGFRQKVDEEKLKSIGKVGKESLERRDQRSSNREIQERQKMVKEDDTKDMMARMLEGNQNLTELVAELCRSNALQTQIISSLSQRVES